jgi:hypothetical protein
MSYCTRFWVPGRFTQNMTKCTCLRGMTKNYLFSRLWSFSWAIAHSFGGSGTIYEVYVMFERHDKNFPFFVFYGQFWSYCPQFWGPEAIYKAHNSRYMLKRHHQKCVVFVFMALFVSYCPQFWSSEAIYTKYDKMYMFDRHDKNLSIFVFMVVFVSFCLQFWGSSVIYKVYVMFETHNKKLSAFTLYGKFNELLPTVLGFQGDLQGPWHSVHVWEAWPKTRHFCVYGRFMSYCP